MDTPAGSGARVQQSLKIELVINPKSVNASRLRALLHCICLLVAYSVALNPFCQSLLIRAKRTAMLRRGNVGF